MPITLHCNWDDCPHTTEDPAESTKHRAEVHDHKFIPGQGFNRAPPDREPHEGELRHDEDVDPTLDQEKVKYWKEEAARVKLIKSINEAQNKSATEHVKPSNLPPNTRFEGGLLRVGLVDPDGNVQGVYFDPNDTDSFMRRVEGWTNEQNRKEGKPENNWY